MLNAEPRRAGIHPSAFFISRARMLTIAIMAKTRTQFLCNQCGSVHPKWLGKCPDCGTWDALEAYTPPAPDARAATPDALRGAEPIAIGKIDEEHMPRLAT